MFRSLKRVVYCVSDIEEATQWYASLLGRRPLFSTPHSAIFQVGDCTLSLTSRDSSNSESPDKTEIYWEVEDVEAAFQKLVDAGAREDTPVRDALNIRIAKLIDPFGNLIGITGEIPGSLEKNVEKQPSGTAMTVAFCRALANLDDRDEIRGPDDLAILFLTDEGRRILQEKASRTWAIRNLVTSALYGYFIARTAYFDDVFRKYTAAGIPQIVFLGAGYDTRPYRISPPLANTRIIELDAAPTQKRKIGILNDNGISIPSQVTFAEVNFITGNSGEILVKNGFNPSLKTLFIWEGVSYYLSNEAVEEILYFIASFAAPGSYLCFDYLKEKLESVNKAEPFRFWIDTGEMQRLLSEKGFGIIEHTDPEQMSERYLTLHDGKPAENILSQFCFVLAELHK